jgi:hypothetical protein
MKTVDIHAHIIPDSFWRATDAKKEWHGFKQCALPTADEKEKILWKNLAELLDIR